MSSLFDRLQNELEDRDKDSGITPLDLADLPPILRKMMRVILREVEMTRDDLIDSIKSLLEGDQIEDEDLDKSLEALVKQSWLIVLGEGERLRYRVNLRRKKTLDLDSSIWNALESKVEPKPPKEEDE
jgi:hypothetical protein